MIEKNKIKFLGRSDIQFTDEKGISYIIGSEMLASKKYDMVIFTKEIEPVDKKMALFALLFFPLGVFFLGSKPISIQYTPQIVFSQSIFWG